MTPTKIGFVLLSNSRNPVPSTRIAALNMFPFLRTGGFVPEILFEPDAVTGTPELPDLVARARERGTNVVVFQKIHGPSALKQVIELAAVGIKTVYAVCDLVATEMARATDASLVVTDYLKSLYPEELQPKLHVVHDGIERPDAVKTEWQDHRGSPANPLRAVLVTSTELDCLPVLDNVPDWLNISIVGRYSPSHDRWQRLRRDKWTYEGQPNLRRRLAFLRFLANRRIRRVAWDSVRVYETLQRADLAIIPIDRSEQTGHESLPAAWRLKSENRLTMKMSVGLPVIATPIPSYEPVIEQGSNGFLAQSRSDWLHHLAYLREPELRRTIGERARASVVERYSQEEQASRLLGVLAKLAHP